MKEIKTMFEELKDRANQLSAGEAIIVLDEIYKKQSIDDAFNFLNSNMEHIREAMLQGTFNLKGCRNINYELAKELIAKVQKQHISTVVQTTHYAKTTKKRI